jgi:hypothetical protein
MQVSWRRGAADQGKTDIRHLRALCLRTSAPEKKPAQGGLNAGIREASPALAHNFMRE